MLFTFPSRYLYTIGLPGVFSLAGWSRQIRAGFHVSRVTQEIPTRERNLRVRGFHPLWPCFPEGSTSLLSQDNGLLQPPARRNAPGLGSSAFARHYLRNHSYFLLLRLLRCFSSPRSPQALSLMPGLQPGGLSHSEIRASTVICT